jgi:hypothetical protein
MAAPNTKSKKLSSSTRLISLLFVCIAGIYSFNLISLQKLGVGSHLISFGRHLAIDDADSGSLSITAAHPTSVCGECKFCMRGQSVNSSVLPHAHVIRMTNSGGFGRTGNSVTTMMHAMKLAYACKSILELPSTDEHRAFDFQEEYRFLDFTQRQGKSSSHSVCDRELIEGNAGTFWGLSDELAMRGSDSVLQLRYSWTDQPEVMHDLWTCMRRFLGICIEGLCSGQRSARDGVLTVHLRQGDVSPPIGGHAPEDYQQPFLDYYYSIINYTNPSAVLFIGENVNHGPVWKAFEKLNSFGLTRLDIWFQSSSFREDLVTMLCAQTIVESMSSLMTVVRLGFATSRFSMCCENHFPEAQLVYRVEPGTYNGGRHDNSADEWVAMLLRGNEPVPKLCTAKTLMDDASSAKSHCAGTPDVFGWE